MSLSLLVFNTIYTVDTVKRYNLTATKKLIPSYSPIAFITVLVSVSLKCSDENSCTTLKNYVDLISNLGSGEKVVVMTTEQPPEGCAIQTVSAHCEVHMMLKVRI